jgi:CXXX repeat peptide maturase
MPVEMLHATSLQSADVVVFNSVKDFSVEKMEENTNKIFVLRTACRDVACRVSTEFPNGRLNIIITDIETFTEKDFEGYKQWLSELKIVVYKVYCNGKAPQINILTDRILLEKMNNCNAGYESITLAPNGEFYVCPAFYIENEKDSIGNLRNGLDIKNQQLYKLEYAPLCRICDAYQCKRCVWLNRKTTLEVNTPSHEQCVVAHLERNMSENLLKELQTVDYFPDKEIPAIDYLDPFDTIKN